jgi:hypothetical protein
MYKLCAILLAGLLAFGDTTAFASDGTSASYASGTVGAIAPSTAGTLDTVSLEALGFRAGQSHFSIPYTQITSFHYREESKLHIGILATIAVALFAPWEKVERITIVWSGERGDPQVATLVLGKHEGQGLMSIIEARAPRACSGGPSRTCGREY